MKKLLILAAAVVLHSAGTKGQTMNNVGTTYPGTPSSLNGIPSQLQTAQDGQILFQGSNVFGSDAARNSIRLGIGVFDSPVNGVADRLHLHDITASSVFSRFTNSVTMQTATDGLVLGIDASGHGILGNFENLPLQFYTNTAERMRIQANGFIGVNTMTASNRVEIKSDPLDPSASGLRFTNLTNASVPTANSSAVLSVDANGDVILVNSVATATAFASKNGLNSVVGSPSVELGGFLIRDTEIKLGGNNLVFNKKGRVGFGEFVDTTNLSAPIAALGSNNAKMVFDNGDFETSHEIYAYAPTSFSNAYVYGLKIQATNDNATSSNGAIGSFAKVISESINAGHVVDVESSNSNVSGNNVGFSATVKGNKETYGAYLETYQSSFYETVANSKNWGLTTIATGGAKTRGTHSIALNGVESYGGYFVAEQENPSIVTNTVNTGVYADASYSSNYNIGVHGRANGVVVTGGVANKCTAVYGFADSGAEVIAIHGQVPANGSSNAGTVNLAGYFEGDVVITGTCSVAGAPVITSDRQIKTNITSITNGIEIISKLNPRMYNLTNANCPQLNFIGSKTQYGLIAQEVEETFPDIVYGVKIPSKRDETGKVLYPQKDLKGVSYDQLIAVLIKGMQEQQEQINTLTEKITSLTQTSNTPAENKTNGGVGVTENRVDLTSENIVILEQNIPNPFMDNTVINYTLPKSYATAKIVFTTNEGIIVKTVDLTTLSGNSINVYATGLNHGLYTYTLVVDGKIMDTKRMIKE